MKITLTTDKLNLKIDSRLYDFRLINFIMKLIIIIIKYKAILIWVSVCIISENSDIIQA